MRGQTVWFERESQGCRTVAIVDIVAGLRKMGLRVPPQAQLEKIQIRVEEVLDKFTNWSATIESRQAMQNQLDSILRDFYRRGELWKE